MSDDSQIKLRLSNELKDYIDGEAKENYRTTNSEVVFRLEQSKWFNKAAIEKNAHDFAYILASTLIQDPKVEIHNTVHGFRQPSLKGIQQAFELFLLRDVSNRQSFGVEETEAGTRFFRGSDEYLIEAKNPYPEGAYTINHLARILEKLYFRPLMLQGR